MPGLGFRTGISTESGVLCLKQTVLYFTTRKSSVIARFLNLSKAFVNYGMLWQKFGEDSSLPSSIVSICSPKKFWLHEMEGNRRSHEVEKKTQEIGYWDPSPGSSVQLRILRHILKIFVIFHKWCRTLKILLTKI